MMCGFKKFVSLLVCCLLFVSFLFVGLVQAVTVETVTVGGTPYDLAVTPDGKYVYVPIGSDGVAVIDTSTNKLLTTINTEKFSRSVVVAPDGEYVYVVNDFPVNMGSGASVSVISVVTNKVTKTVQIEGTSLDVAITSNGKYVYVLTSNSVLVNVGLNEKKVFGLVTVIDTDTYDVVTTVSAGFSSCAIAIASNGCAYVANGDGTLSVIDDSFNVETKKIADENVGFHDIAVTPDDKYLYVALFDEVLVVNADNNSVVAVVTGLGACNGVAVTPDGKHVYVTDGGNNAVSVINTATNTVEYTMYAGPSPYGVVILPNEKFAYVTNLDGKMVGDYDLEFTGRVSVVSTDPNLVTTLSPNNGSNFDDYDLSINTDFDTDETNFFSSAVFLQMLLFIVVVCVLLVVIFVVVKRVRHRPKMDNLVNSNISDGVSRILVMQV